MQGKPIFSSFQKYHSSLQILSYTQLGPAKAWAAHLSWKIEGSGQFRAVVCSVENKTSQTSFLTTAKARIFNY